MGTGKTGRVLNTAGSGTTVSGFAAVHSTEGKFIQSSKKHGGGLRLVSGGHGQVGMNLLDKYGIGYKVLKTYPNGVRIGNINNHKRPNKRLHGGQSWFPKSWTLKDVIKAGTHVAKLQVNRHSPDGKKLFGMFKGVRIVVIKTHGKIATVFPDTVQPNKRKGHKK